MLFYTIFIKGDVNPQAGRRKKWGKKSVNGMGKKGECQCGHGTGGNKTCKAEPPETAAGEYEEGIGM